MKKTAFLTFVLLLALTLTLPTLAATATVKDDAGLLTDADLSAIAAIDTTPEVRYFVLTEVSSSADDYPSNSEVLSRCGIDSSTSSVILVIRKVTTTYYYDMYTFGEADSLFSGGDIDAVLDDEAVYDNIKGGRAGAGAAAFVSLCDAHCRRELAPTPVWQGVLIALAVGTCAGGGTALGVFLFYRRKLHGETYPLDRYANLQLTDRRDRFAGSFVTRVRVNSSSSSGGGGGGGGGGGRRGGR